jgi:hypothetical protein
VPAFSNRRNQFSPRAQWHHTTDPNTLLFRSRNLVADSLAGDLTLKLGKRQKDIEGESSHAGRRVERLGNRYEAHIMMIEQLDELGKIGQRSRQPIDLVDNDDVNSTTSNRGKELLQGRAVHAGAGETAIFEGVASEPPALMRLALDTGLAGFALGIQRIEVLFESTIGRDARVDRTACPDGRLRRNLPSPHDWSPEVRPLSKRFCSAHGHFW